VLRYGLEVLLGLVLLLILGLVLLAVRRRYIQRGASFDASIRTRKKRFGQGWTLGVARYGDNSLEWFRVFSLGLRPRVFPRDELFIGERRDPVYPENLAILPGHVIVACKVIGEDLELAMSPEALTGFVAWREASPPGRHLATS
jgi:hypothetical protein